jgi:uncharacterized LabA/DUF88 family protein
MDERVAVVANIHSLFHASKAAFGLPISYGALMRDVLKGRRALERVACVHGNPRNQEKFLEALSIIGFNPVLSRNEEALRDQFTNEMIRLAPLVDVLVLLTCDESIAPITDYLEITNRLPKIEVWAVDGYIKDDLRDCADTVKSITRAHLYEQVNVKQ